MKAVCCMLYTSFNCFFCCAVVEVWHVVVPIVIVVVVAAAVGAVCILIKGESININVQSL